jgi:hypothetical protein
MSKVTVLKGGILNPGKADGVSRETQERHLEVNAVLSNPHTPSPFLGFPVLLSSHHNLRQGSVSVTNIRMSLRAKA